MTPKRRTRLRDLVPVGCALLVLGALLLASNSLPAEEREPLKPTCTGSLQAKIDDASPGSTVNLADDCIYRETVAINKPLVLRGAGAGEIRGSDVWDAWNTPGSGWVSSKSVPRFAAPSNYRCEGASRRCRWPEQVFVDGEPLQQVAWNPRPGQFALDPIRRVVLAEDPAGRVVEVTVRERWVLGASDGVTVQGITMKHAAGDGLWNGGHSGWTVKNNDLSHAHAKNLSLTLGGSLLAKNNDLHDAGQMGMNSNRADIEILGNRVYGNNTEEFDPGWAAGGMKIAQPRTALIAGNEVYDNRNIGIWTDVVNEEQSSVEISRNRVHHQPGQGIRVEITKNFDVHHNLVWENGWGEGDSYTGTGITVAGSRDGTVNDNVLAWNASGIAVVQQNRDGAGEQPYDTVRNVRLNRNRIAQDEIPGSSNHAAALWNDDGGAISEGAPSLYDPAANNGGADNGYWFDAPEGQTNRFKGEEQLKTLAAFNATPAEQRGRYLSDAEKDALLRTNGLPTAPEDHPSITSSILEWLCRPF